MLQMLKHRPLGSCRVLLAQSPGWRTRQGSDEVRSLPAARLIGARDRLSDVQDRVRTDKRDRAATKAAACHASACAPAARAASTATSSSSHDTS